MNIFQSVKNLSSFERRLWLLSVAAVILSAVLTHFKNPFTSAASFIGVTALIFVAKGDVLGQLLTVVFSLFYGFISYTFRYYGEMITYLCMSAPMAAMAVASWLKNPFEKGKPEVRVNRIGKKELILMFVMAAVVTVIFYFILALFRTPNLIPSTLSVTTSFLAAYLTFRRSEFYALAYAANDLVLIVLWIFAAREDMGYLSMAVCFLMFFANDMYGFINWKRMKRRQGTATLR